MTAYQLLRKEATVPVSGREQVTQPPVGQVRGADTQGGGLGEQLDARMQARMQRFLDNQNPQAEQEADSIAASVSGARTPEEVKAQLGERMGADFSNVRFHTGSDAVQKAEGIGARAYATGRDVYFGEGGFDPSVAAHELVHTAQQGMVDSGMATQSVSAGTVQMLPKWMGRAGQAIKNTAAKVKGFFGGNSQAPDPEAELDQYFPARHAFTDVSRSDLETRRQQSENTGNYLLSKGVEKSDPSQSNALWLNGITWGRQMQGLYRHGDDAYNEQLRNLFTVGKTKLNEDLLDEASEDPSQNRAGVTDEAFTRLGGVMAPIVQQMMGLDLDSIGTDEASVRQNYEMLNNLAAQYNSISDLRKGVQGKTGTIKDPRMAAMYQNMGHSQADVSARHLAISNKLIAMNRSMGVKGGLRTGRDDQTDAQGNYHIDPRANPEYEALLAQRQQQAEAPKKKWWQFWK